MTVDNVPDIKAYSQAIDQSGRSIWLTASAWPVDLSAADGLRPYANGVDRHRHRVLLRYDFRLG